MSVLIRLLVLIAGFFRPLITPVKTGQTAPGAMEQAGALVPNGAVVQAVTNLANNAAPAFGNWSQTLIAASLTATTYQAAQIVGGIIRRFSPGAAFTDCTDTATNIVNAIPGAVPLQTFPVIIANLGSGLETLAGGSGVTIAGTSVIGSATGRLFLGQVTGSGAVTLTNCFGWNLGTGGTLVAGL